MAREWLAVDAASTVVVGHRFSSKATTIPDDTAETTHVDTTGTGLVEEWRNKQTIMRDAGRNARVRWNGTALVIPPDNRPILEITSTGTVDPDEDAVLIDADNTDSVTLTVTAKRRNGTVNTNYQGNRVVDVDSGDRILTMRFNFVDGIATRPFRTRHSGRYRARSNPKFQIDLTPTIAATD